MRSVERVRDWQISEYLDSVECDSFDFIGRDLQIAQGLKVPFMKYRRQNYLVEARFYHSEEISMEEAINDLERAREVIESHGFVPRLQISDVDNFRSDYEEGLKGDYFFDPDSDILEVERDLNELLYDEVSDLDILVKDKNM